MEALAFLGGERDDGLLHMRFSWGGDGPRRTDHLAAIKSSVADDSSAAPQTVNRDGPRSTSLVRAGWLADSRNHRGGLPVNVSRTGLLVDGAFLLSTY